MTETLSIIPIILWERVKVKFFFTHSLSVCTLAEDKDKWLIIISADVPTRNEKPLFGVLNLPLFNDRMRKAGLDEQAVMLYVYCMSTLTLSCLCSALTDSFGHSFFVDMFNSEIAELAWYSEKFAFGARQKCKHHLGCWHEFADTSLCPSWPIREVTSYLQSCSSCQDYGFHSRDRWVLSPKIIHKQACSTDRKC